MAQRETLKVKKISVIVVEPDKIWAVIVNGDLGSFQVVKSSSDFTCNCPPGLAGKFCLHKRAVMEVEQIKLNIKEQKLVTGAERGESRTKSGYVFGEVTSAIQKEIRLGNEEMALFWALEMEATSPTYLWKRLMVIASEDIGLAAPDVVLMVNVLALGWERAKKLSWYVSSHQVAQAVMMMCRAPKSTEVEDAIGWTGERKAAGFKPEIPEYAKDMHTQAGKERGRVEGLGKEAMYREWYLFRRNDAGMPDNPYLKKLEEMHPDWFNEPKKML